MSDFDSPWKEALEHFFELFLAFFFPEIHAVIDWARDYDSLDSELQKLAPEGELGRRHADRFVKVHGKPPADDSALLHVEVQSQQEADLPRRIYVYNYRGEDRYNQPVVSVVVLGDDNPNWRPNEYVFEKWGCTKTFTFPVAKLLEYAGREAELEAHANPFALFVLAHLQAQATRDDPAARSQWKVRLIQGLAGRGLLAEDVRQWCRLIDWLLDLPPEQDRQAWQEIARFAEDTKMTFVSYPERVGFEKGYDVGRNEGRNEGRKEALLKYMDLALKLKFGAADAALLQQLQQQTDLDLLERVFRTIETAQSVEELRALLPATA